MKKLAIIIIAISVLAIVGGATLFSKDKGNSASEPTSTPDVTEYFYSNTCPHCAKVAEFMNDWPGKDKFQLQKFEVNESADNRNKFLARGIYCKISRNDLGVPLMVTTDGQCLTGDQPIIDYLKSIEL